MKQIIENLMKHTRHAELDSASHSVILRCQRHSPIRCWYNFKASLRVAKNLKLAPSLALPLKGRGESVLCAIPTSKSIKVVPMSTDSATCVKHVPVPFKFSPIFINRATCVKHIPTPFKSSPTSTGRATCVAHDKNLSTYRLNVLETDKNPLPNPLPWRGNKVKSALPQGARGKCVAFTLAETLITLGIIGVVAAVTIPSLITKYQKHQTIVRLKEAYTLINQAVRLSENEFGDISDWDYKASGFGEKYFQKTLKLTRISYSKLKLKPWKSLNGTIDNSGSGMYTHQQFIMNNGMHISFFPNYYPESKNRRKIGVWIFVDINGAKGPNRFGRDVFVMSIFPNRYPGEKVVMGAHDQCGGGDIHRGLTRNSLLNNGCARCNKNYTGLGYGCSYLIQLDGWQISDDYPW